MATRNLTNNPRTRNQNVKLSNGDNFMSDYSPNNINNLNASTMAQTEINENKISDRIEEFFKKRVKSEEFAKHLRKYRHETFNMAINENEENFDKPAVLEGAYWIHEFCEILSPYFTAKNS